MVKKLNLMEKEGSQDALTDRQTNGQTDRYNLNGKGLHGLLGQASSVIQKNSFLYFIIFLLKFNVLNNKIIFEFLKIRK